MSKKDFKAVITKGADIFFSDSGIESILVDIKVEDIKLKEEFASLFKIDQAVLNSIVEDISANGYDKTQPVVILKGKNVLIDGHTRLKAVKLFNESVPKNKILAIPAVEVDLAEDEVIEYMYKLQFSRRNIKDSELLPLAQEALKGYVKQYGTGSKAEFLAKKFPTLSETKAKRISIILEKATAEQLEDVTSEKITIYSLYLSIKKSDLDNEKVRTNLLNETETVPFSPKVLSKIRKSKEKTNDSTSEINLEDLNFHFTGRMLLVTSEGKTMPLLTLELWSEKLAEEIVNFLKTKTHLIGGQ